MSNPRLSRLVDYVLRGPGRELTWCPPADEFAAWKDSWTAEMNEIFGLSGGDREAFLDQLDEGVDALDYAEYRNQRSYIGAAFILVRPPS